MFLFSPSVTWGLNPFNSFNNMPRTETEAKTAGFTLISGCGEWFFFQFNFITVKQSASYSFIKMPISNVKRQKVFESNMLISTQSFGKNFLLKLCRKDCLIQTKLYFLRTVPLPWKKIHERQWPSSHSYLWRQRLHRRNPSRSEYFIHKTKG